MIFDALNSRFSIIVFIVFIIVISVIIILYIG